MSHDLSRAAADGSLFAALERIDARPEVFSVDTLEALWTSPDISEMLLRFHLDGEVDVASRRTAFIARSAEWLRTTFELGPGRRVLDLGCGPGLYANRLARSGAAITAIDLSSRSVEHGRAAAQREGLPVEYLVGDYLTHPFEPSFDLVLLIMCDYCGFAPARRQQLLERVADLLAPGGAFVFDVYSLAAFETWEEDVAYGRGLMDGFWSAADYYGFLDTFRYEAEKVVLEKYVIVARDGVREYFDWFQHFDPAMLRTEVEAAGLVVDEVLGDVAGAPYEREADEFALIVRPPG